MNWLSLVASLLTSLPTIIKDVENVITEVKAGMTKKATVTSIINSVASVAGATSSQVASIAPAVSSVIDSTVSTLNASGAFKTSTPAKAS
jgi:hypothetical protein